MACGQDIILKLVTKALQPTMLKIERALKDIGPKMKAEGERMANQQRSSSRDGSGGMQLSRPTTRQGALQQALSVHQAYLQQQDPNHHYGTATTTPTRSQAKPISDSDFPTVEVVVCATETLMKALFGHAVVKG